MFKLYHFNDWPIGYRNGIERKNTCMFSELDFVIAMQYSDGNLLGRPAPVASRVGSEESFEWC